VHNDGFIDSVSADRIKNFGKFVRGSNSQIIEPAGSGLGLYITKRMIEASGGTVWFESNANEGTTFYVTIIKN
jgi:signal transduction histidine kinase